MKQAIKRAWGHLAHDLRVDFLFAIGHVDELSIRLVIKISDGGVNLLHFANPFTSREFRIPVLGEARSGKTLLRRLEGVLFILPTCGEYFDPLISRLIDASNTRLEIVVRDCSAELALAHVRDGLGISVVPSTWVLGMDELRTFELADVEAGNVLRYICRTDHEPSVEEQLFIGCLRDWIRKQLHC